MAKMKIIDEARSRARKNEIRVGDLVRICERIKRPGPGQQLPPEDTYMVGYFRAYYDREQEKLINKGPLGRVVRFVVDKQGGQWGWRLGKQIWAVVQPVSFAEQPAYIQKSFRSAPRMIVDDYLSERMVQLRDLEPIREG